MTLTVGKGLTWILIAIFVSVVSDVIGDAIKEHRKGNCNCNGRG